MQNQSIIFNSNDISKVPGVFLYNYNATDLPERDIAIHKVARRSLSIVTSSEYTQKAVTVQIKIRRGNDRNDTEQAVTEIKGLLSAQNGLLEVRLSGAQYKYTATMNEFNISWTGATAWVEIVFIASTPVAESVQTVVLFNFSTSLSSDGMSFIVGGSYTAEPKITLVYSAVAGGTNKTINLYNASTNQGISVTADFTNTTIVEIDCSEYTVLVNGAQKDFEGLFPTFPPGSQRVAYSDDFTSRTVSIAGTARTRIV